jgi:hypothetical protein
MLRIATGITNKDVWLVMYGFWMLLERFGMKEWWPLPQLNKVIKFLIFICINFYFFLSVTISVTLEPKQTK